MSHPTPFPCCDHCGCGESDSPWRTRGGHYDACPEGCNAPDQVVDQ